MGICNASQAHTDLRARYARGSEGPRAPKPATDKHVMDNRVFIAKAKWPILLLDTSSSMAQPTAPHNPAPRSDAVREVVRALSARLAAIGNADRHSGARGAWVRGSGAKGVPLVTFNGDEDGRYRGFVTPAAVNLAWAAIEFGGAATVMEGWHEAVRRYRAQFDGQPEATWPVLLVMVITDGDLLDGGAFEDHLRRMRCAFAEIARFGFGDAADRARYRATASNPHARTTAFDWTADAGRVADRLLGMVDPALFAAAAHAPRPAPPSYEPPAPQIGPPALPGHLPSNAS